MPSKEIGFGRVFPNPSSGLTCIEIINDQSFNGSLSLVNVLGQTIETIHKGHFKGNSRKYFLDVSNYSSGLYVLKLMSNKGLKTIPLLIK